MSQMSFDELFMNEAYLYASKSKDSSTQVGAVIVKDNHSIMRGYNGPLRGADDSNPRLKDKAYKRIASEHAERNAIFNCARLGISCDECSIYITFTPCVECSRAIIQAGIKEVVIHADAPVHSSADYFHLDTGIELMEDAAIQIRKWSGRIIIPGIRFDGKYHQIGNTDATV